MRTIFDNEGHGQFVTFSCNMPGGLLDDERCKRIVIAAMGSALAIGGCADRLGRGGGFNRGSVFERARADGAPSCR